MFANIFSCTMPQAGRSRFRFPMRSLDFSIDLILPAELRPLEMTLQRNESLHSRTAVTGTHFMRYACCYSWTSEPNRLHHTSCRQPCGLKALGLQRGIMYEISRDRRSWVDRITADPLPTSTKSLSSLNNISLR
jgi:hypothetical protein